MLEDRLHVNIASIESTKEVNKCHNDNEGKIEKNTKGGPPKEKNLTEPPSNRVTAITPHESLARKVFSDSNQFFHFSSDTYDFNFNILPRIYHLSITWLHDKLKIWIYFPPIRYYILVLQSWKRKKAQKSSPKTYKKSLHHPISELSRA